MIIPESVFGFLALESDTVPPKALTSASGFRAGSTAPITLR